MQTIPYLLLVLILVGAGCGSSDAASEPEEWVWDLPEGVLPPRVPEDNPMSEAKVELGRFLFYDKRLSANETQSCASCHQQDLAFTDGLTQAKGSTGEIHPRNSMMLANAGYAASLTWANDTLEKLEEQALVPMFGEMPVELGMAGVDEELLRRMRDDDRYPDMFASAFPNEEDPIVLGNITKAIAAFQRQLTSFNSPYDRWTYDRDRTALNESEQRGMALFFGEKLECFHCHGGFLLSQASDHEQNTFDQKSFMNNGLYNLDEDGSYPTGNQGLYDLSFEPVDKGRFKPPSLRNIAVTAPYMHDGSIATLEEVIDHYARGGRLVPEGTVIKGQDVSGDGRDNPNKSAFIKGFELTDQEREDVLAFLRALTDEEFLTNPVNSDPFVEE
ncbi:MAG: di-heme enzyme [Myxococcales bacterium]|nr:MAG: di-heme enzyme [Myxococcales bacterium]